MTLVCFLIFIIILSFSRSS